MTAAYEELLKLSSWIEGRFNVEASRRTSIIGPAEEVLDHIATRLTALSEAAAQQQLDTAVAAARAIEQQQQVLPSPQAPWFRTPLGRHAERVHANLVRTGRSLEAGNLALAMGNLAELHPNESVELDRAFQTYVDSNSVSTPASRAERERAFRSLHELGLFVMRPPAPSADTPPAAAPASTSAPIGCFDCGMPYRDFPLDIILPRGQWLRIFPREAGVLCAQCIVTRASRVPGATVLHAVIDITPATAGQDHP